MVAFIVVWALAWAANVLFTGSFSAEELAAGAALGAIVSLWSAAVRRGAMPPFAYERGVAATAAKAVAGLPGATARVGIALGKALFAPAPGRIARQAFARGRTWDAHDAGRRATMLLAWSLAPERFVLRLAEGEDEMILHRLP